MSVNIDFHDEREWDAERVLDAIAEWLDARAAHLSNQKRLVDEGVWEVGYASSDTSNAELAMRREAVAKLLGLMQS